MKDLPKTWVSPHNRLKLSDQKLKNFAFGHRKQNKTKQRNHKTPKATTEDGTCNQEEIN